MIKQNRLLICVGITTLVILFMYLFFYLIGPIMLVGPPLPLYHIYNNTSGNHTILIEILDEGNISVRKDTYILTPGEDIEYEREIGWYPKISWYLVTWPEGTYTLDINLDDEYTEIYTTDVSPTQSVIIELFHEDYRTNEIFPIYIKEIAV